MRAGGLPVWVGPPDGGGGGVTAVSRVRVSVASQAAARVLGVRGVVLSVARTGGASAAGRVHLSVSYAGFAQAYGGDYGSRLRLVELAGCALSAPAVAACRTRRPVGSLNDARRDWAGADVTLPRARAVVLALVAGASGSAGNFAAEPLSEASTGWVTGPSSGAYTWSYPVSVPPVPGGWPRRWRWVMTRRPPAG